MKSWLLVSSLGLLAGLGCGGDEKKGGAGSGKALSELTDKEAEDVCEGFNTRLKKFADPTKKLKCFVENADDCEDDAIEECVDDAPDLVKEFDCDGISADEIAEGCEDTSSAEAFACLDAISKAIANVTDKLSCDTKAEDIEDDLEKASEPPAACTKIEKKCPIYSSDLYDEEGEDTDEEGLLDADEEEEEEEE